MPVLGDGVPPAPVPPVPVPVPVGDGVLDGGVADDGEGDVAVPPPVPPPAITADSFWPAWQCEPTWQAKYVVAAPIV